MRVVLNTYILTVLEWISTQKFSLLLLCSYCGVKDPSWAEIRHFVWFLDKQLESCEKSVFFDEALVGDIIGGLKSFVVRFMIEMSRVRQFYSDFFLLVVYPSLLLSLQYWAFMLAMSIFTGLCYTISERRSGSWKWSRKCWPSAGWSWTVPNCGDKAVGTKVDLTVL